VCSFFHACIIKLYIACNIISNVYFIIDMHVFGIDMIMKFHYIEMYAILVNIRNLNSLLTTTYDTLNLFSNVSSDGGLMKVGGVNLKII